MGDFVLDPLCRQATVHLNEPLKVASRAVCRHLVLARKYLHQKLALRKRFGYFNH
jgi:hypothetical protein